MDSDRFGLLGHSFGGAIALGATQEEIRLPQFGATDYARPSALKTQFQRIKPMQAIFQVLSSEQQPLSIDDLITALYNPFDSTEIARARKSVAITAKHAERRGLIEKVQDHPARFQSLR